MALAAIPWGILTAFSFIKSEFFTHDLQDKWQLIKINPWPWWAWSLVTMVIIIAVILEGTYRVVSNREKDNGLLVSKITELTNAEFKARADCLRRSTEIIGLQQELTKARENNGLQHKQLKDLDAAFTDRSNLCSEAHKKFVEADSECTELKRKLAKANDDLERLRRPDDCPIVSVVEWGAFGPGSTQFMPHGFYVNNNGQKPAYEVTIKKFKIGDRFAVSSPLNEIGGGGTRNGQIPVWIDGLSGIEGRFDLLEAFNVASKAKDGETPPYGRPNFPVTANIFYRDHRDLWYESIVEIIFMPPRFGGGQNFSFKFLSQKFLGHDKPDMDQAN